MPPASQRITSRFHILRRSAQRERGLAPVLRNALAQLLRVTRGTIHRQHARKLVDTLEESAKTVGVDTQSALAAVRNFQDYFVGSAKAANDVVPPGVKPSDPEHLFSKAAIAELAQALGPEAGPFIELYQALGALAAAGKKPTRALQAELTQSVVNLHRIVSPQSGTSLSAPVLHEAHRVLGELTPLLTELRGTRADSEVWPKIATLYQGMIQKLAQDKGVFLTPTKTEAWAPLRRMRPAERTMAEIEREDPELFAFLNQRKQVYRDVDAAIEEAIRANGLTGRKASLQGRLVNIGRDERTGEERVFDYDGDILPIPEFLQKRARFLAGVDQLSKPPRSVKLEDLRSVSDEELEALTGPVTQSAYTDDKAKMGQLTRIFETRELEGRRVVVSGRYKGIYLDDLINSQGRLVEGTAYRYSGRSGRTAQRVKLNPGEREPYVTVAQVRENGELKDKLFLQLPGGLGNWTAVRRNLRALSTHVPSIQYEPGSRNSSFTFEPKDFGAVREALHGMSLSRSALQTVKTYFEELAAAERATADGNLGYFMAAALGGFKSVRRTRGGESLPVELRTVQKQALAWLEANGDRGIVALDMGEGKTLVAIAQMQKLLRGGLSPDKGRFLYVAPRGLRGNLTMQIRRFLTPEAARALLSRVDIVSYGELSAATRNGKLRGKPWSGDQYAAAFFDEGQVLRDITNKRTQAALALKVDKKVILTASPMERSPMDLYVLACVAGGVDLTHPELGKAARSEMRKFQERYIEMFGGRPVGVKSDPVLRQELHTWVKRNLFFSDRLHNLDLPRLETPDSEGLAMSPAMEREYRKIVGEIEGKLRERVEGLKRPRAGEAQPGMEALTTLYRDHGRTADGSAAQESPALRAAFGLELKQLFRKLDRLTLLPREFGLDEPSPKLDRAAQVLLARMAANPSSRAVLFAEDADCVKESARVLSQQVPGKLHAAGLNDRVLLYQDGRVVQEYTERAYQGVDAGDGAGGRRYRPREWQQYVLDEVITPNTDVASATLQGEVYQNGHNLQAFDTVIHLDRDSWSSQNMQQRTARVWRNGQTNPVQVRMLDMVYPGGGDDLTYDQIRAHAHALGDGVFDEIIKDAQATELGKEWFDLDARSASSAVVRRDVAELMLSPYLERAAETSV